MPPKPLRNTPATHDATRTQTQTLRPQHHAATVHARAGHMRVPSATLADDYSVSSVEVVHSDDSLRDPPAAHTYSFADSLVSAHHRGVLREARAQAVSAAHKVNKAAAQRQGRTHTGASRSHMVVDALKEHSGAPDSNQGEQAQRCNSEGAVRAPSLLPAASTPVESPERGNMHRDSHDQAAEAHVSESHVLTANAQQPLHSLTMMPSRPVFVAEVSAHDAGKPGGGSHVLSIEAEQPPHASTAARDQQQEESVRSHGHVDACNVSTNGKHNQGTDAMEQLVEYEQLIEDLHSEVVGLREQLNASREENQVVKKSQVAWAAQASCWTDRVRALEQENMAIKVIFVARV
jgi:hypothetical protein